MSTTPAPAPAPGYLLLFRDVSADSYKGLSPEESQRLFAQWYDWYERLAAAGKLLHGHPLENAGRVVSARDGRVMDGPFVEAKEVVGGYFYLTVATLEEAVEIAKQCPTLQHNIGLTVEVRPVAGLCPVLSATAADEERARKIVAAS